MVKRAALARALALDPKLLFLDEPTSGLDPIGAQAFDELVVYLQRELQLTVVMITHDLDTLFGTCTRVGVLVDGKMITDTTGRHRPQSAAVDSCILPGRARGSGRLVKGSRGMEREANYVAVGAFVLLVVTMATLFVYWYSDGRDQRNYTRYEVYFDGSVSGLIGRRPGALPRRRRRPRGAHPRRSARCRSRAGDRRRRRQRADLRAHASPSSRCRALPGCSI